MNSIISSSPSVPASQEMPLASSSLTDLDFRIQQIRQRCDELRKQKPKYFFLYQFGFAISLIGAAVSIVLLNKNLLACSVFIGSLFWKTISRNNKRIQCIDALQQKELDHHTVLNFMVSLRANLENFQSSLEKIQSNLNSFSRESDIMEEINRTFQDLTYEIQNSRNFLLVYNDSETSAFKQQLEDISSLQISMLFNREKIWNEIGSLREQLRSLDECISQLMRNFQDAVVSLQESVNLNTALMNRWVI